MLMANEVTRDESRRNEVGGKEGESWLGRRRRGQGSNHVALSGPGPVPNDDLAYLHTGGNHLCPPFIDEANKPPRSYG